MAWVFVAVVGLVAIWMLVCVMLASMSGWGRLAEIYPATSEIPRDRKAAGGRIGGVAYNGCLVLSANEHGLRIGVLALFRIAHPTIFIPWSELAISEGKTAFESTVVLKRCQAPETLIELPRSMSVWLREQSQFAGLPEY